MSDRRTLVIGATGQQGGAVIDALLLSKTRRHLRAFVRHPDSPAAKALTTRGVDLVQGDLDDTVSLRRAMQGTDSVYSVQSPMEGGPAGEERQGKAVADAAVDAKVGHLVYSSVAGAERHSGIPHFESKRRVELYLAQSGIPTTILRPVLFMDNFATFGFRSVMLTMLRTFVDDQRPVQMVAVRDIGRFAALAFDRPDGYAGRQIELAGDAITRRDLVAALRATGKGSAMSMRVPAWMQSRIPEEYRSMMQWIATKGFEADIATLRSNLPGLLTVKNWAKAV